jgi:hypothetical protein
MFGNVPRRPLRQLFCSVTTVTVFFLLLACPEASAQQPPEDIAGSYGGPTSGSAFNCTDPLDKGGYFADVNIRLNTPTVDGFGVRRVTGVITVGFFGPNDQDMILDLSAILSAPGNSRTLTSGTLSVRFPSGTTGSGSFTGQWTRGNPDQLILNYTGAGTAFASNCSVSGSVNSSRLGAPPAITFSQGIVTRPPASIDLQVTATQVNGRFQITPRSGVSGEHYNGFVSNQAINLTNYNISVEAKQTTTGGAQTVFGLALDANNFYRFVKVDGTTKPNLSPGELGARINDWDPLQPSAGSFLVFEVKLNGALSSFNVPYDPVLHHHWRFRHDPFLNTINFETSPDKIAWALQKPAVAVQKSVSAMTAELSAGTSISVPAPGAAVLQNLELVSTAPPTTNAIDNAQILVQEHYYDFLNRDPDTSGLAFWTNEITSCGANAQCIEVRRISVSASFFLSIEFQGTGYLVERIYKAAYGDTDGNSTFGGIHTLRVPTVRLNEFLPDTQAIGQGVVVLQPGWEQLLESNKNSFAAEFVQRARFANAFATSMTPTAFVNKLFANAGVTPSSSELTAAINEFGSATTTGDVAARGRALRRVAENGTLKQQEFNRAFVLMQYFGYLRRNPNDPQDTDYTGYDFWLTKLNQFGGNYINAEMVKAFISSIEYRQRFGP